MNESNAITQNSGLIDACNLICEHAESHLPVGWDIRLTIRRTVKTDEIDESSYFELVDPSGDIAKIESVPWGISPIAWLISEAGRLNVEWVPTERTEAVFQPMRIPRNVSG